MITIAVLFAILFEHRPGGKSHRQKRHGWWSKKARGKFLSKRAAARKRLGWD